MIGKLYLVGSDGRQGRESAREGGFSPFPVTKQPWGLSMIERPMIRLSLPKAGRMGIWSGKSIDSDGHPRYGKDTVMVRISLLMGAVILAVTAAGMHALRYM